MVNIITRAGEEHPVDVSDLRGGFLLHTLTSNILKKIAPQINVTTKEVESKQLGFLSDHIRYDVSDLKELYWKEWVLIELLAHPKFFGIELDDSAIKAIHNDSRKISERILTFRDTVAQRYGVHRALKEYGWDLHYNNPTKKYAFLVGVTGLLLLGGVIHRRILR